MLSAMNSRSIPRPAARPFDRTMKRRLWWAAVVLLTAIAVVLLMAAARPASFEVRRTRTIAAPPDRIFALVRDLRAFNTWNPYARKDPSLLGSYTAVSEGKGAAFTFAGNGDVGKGSIEIVDSAPPSRVTMTVRMHEPIEAANTVDFVLEPVAAGTRVTWAMHGRVPYPAKVLHLSLDVDGMVGRDFDAGLASLQALVERAPTVAAR